MVLTLLGILPILVVSKMFGIAFIDGEMLREKGVKQASSVVTIPAVRGTIYDRSGRTLAVNITRFDLGVDPTVSGYDDNASKLYAALERFTGKSASSFRSKVANRSSKQYALLARNLSERQMESLRELGVPGLAPVPTFARRYNYRSTLAHVLGHVDTDLRGIAGIEQQYNAYLTGTVGKRVRKRDRRGVVTASVGSEDIRPRHGESVVLTIDLVRQAIVEEELARGLQEAGAKWATAISMNPRTGEILAMANVPTYDPNRPGSYSTPERRNRSVTDQIEPGSTIKLVSAVTALEENVVSLTDTIDTGNGYAVFGGRAMRDTHAHGKITFEEVIALSSNIGIAKTAQKIKPGDLYQHARDLGFGQRTYIDLPGEAEGVLKKPSEWSGTSLTSISIGYEIAATPLQILTAYSALANDGLLVQPYIVAERRDFDGSVVWEAKPDSIRRAFKGKTARKLIPAFEQVVESGTAKQAQIEGLRIAGKTGTANKVVNGVYRTDISRATFVGFFPADDPQVALIVVMDEPKISTYGGVVSAPVFQRIAQRWMSTMTEAPHFFDEREDEEAELHTAVPAVEGLPVAIAQNRLEAAGFYVKSSGASDSDVVQDQTPEAGAMAAPGERVVLVTAPPDVDSEAPGKLVSNEKVVMPDVTGLGVRQAVFWLASEGITANIEGKGTISKQYPAAGKPVSSSATLVAR